MSKQEKLTNIVSALDQMQEEEAREQLSMLTTFDTRLDRLEEKVEGIDLDDITRDLRHFEERLDEIEADDRPTKRTLLEFEERLSDFEEEIGRKVNLGDLFALSERVQDVEDDRALNAHDDYETLAERVKGIGEGNFALLERIEALEDQAEENARHVNEARRARDAERLLALEERAERPMANAAIRVLIREELISIIRRLLPDEDEKI